jgi:hypothetical protein
MTRDDIDLAIYRLITPAWLYWAMLEEFEDVYKISAEDKAIEILKKVSSNES